MVNVTTWTVGDEAVLLALEIGIPLVPWQMEFLVRQLPEVVDQSIGS